MWDQIKDCLPTDTAKQVNAMYFAHRLAPSLPAGSLVIDLGCGTGVSLDLFRAIAPQARWLGVDIEASPEVNARVRDDGEFRSFDGINIPVEDNSADLVYSRQVLEHVRHPEPLLADVRRVLKPGACFIGSTSQLEPYHSFSYWNYTPLGFKALVDAAGLELAEIRPGIDGVTLTMRAYRGNDAVMNRYFGEESPINQEIDAWAERESQSVQRTAYRKLQFCGQFAFMVKKL